MTDTMKHFEQQTSSTLVFCLVSCSSKIKFHISKLWPTQIWHVCCSEKKKKKKKKKTLKKNAFRSGLPICHKLWDIAFIFFSLILVCSCFSFRENVIVICKIVSFLCSLDNLLLKILSFFFGNQLSKWRSFKKKKKVIFDLLFTSFSHQGNNTKIPSAHISLTYIHIFYSPYWHFCLTNFAKVTNLSCVVSRWCGSWCWFFLCHFGAINKLQNGEQNLGWNVCYWYLFTLMQNL